MSQANMLTKFLRPRSSGLFLFGLLFLIALAPILFLFPTNVYAVDVTLAWDANSEEDLAGYRVFCREDGQSYNYNDPDWEGDKTETSCTIYNLDDHTTYYFVVRAFDTSGNESGNSNEVRYQPNLSPTADAGPDQTVDEGDTVTLEGSYSSDPDGTIDSYAWVQTGGTAVTLSDATAAKPTFTAPDVGPDGESLTFELTVTDDSGLQDTDTCIVNVTWENVPPTADAGPDQTVNEGAPVTLDASNSTDPDDGIASYLWTQTAGPSVDLPAPTAPQPTFTAPSVGVGGQALTFQLEVTDDGGLKNSDTVIINVSNMNQAPTADAGPDQTAGESDTVSLDGSGSYDPDGTIDSYRWAQTAGNPVTLSDPTSATPTFTAPSVGVTGEALTFQLTVTDNAGLSDADTVIINVSNVNQAPTADAGLDQTVDEGDKVTLDGSDSYDPDGTIASYTWTQTAGTSVTLSDATAAQPTFTAPDVGPDGETLTFQLTVTDDGGLKATDSCIVDVSWVDESPVLSSISITGASSVNENSTSNYTATATFSDGTTETVTESAIWSEDSEYASINNTGVLSTSEVTWNETVTITASYSYGNVTKTALKVVTIVDVPESNLAPMKPVITSPSYGQVGCDLLLHITTEPFSDPDGDLHSQSQWQISEQADFASTILDVTSTEHLTELLVPHLLLKPNTTYYVRVRFYDDYLEPSGWSAAIEFTTTADVNDVDANGIPDDQEVGYDVDLNGDGFADNDQPTVIKCIQSSVGNATIGICKVSDSITAIEAVETIDPSTISDNTNRPTDLSFGLFSYRLRINKHGGTATVTIYFSEDISNATTFYKYDTINGWQNYSEHTTFNQDGRSITLELKDGGYGDSDGIANGFIVDPGGLAEASSSEVETSGGTGSSGDGGSSSGGGCFIATAAFGSYVEPEAGLFEDFLAARILCGLLLAGFVLGCFLLLHGRRVTGGERP